MVPTEVYEIDPDSRELRSKGFVKTRGEVPRNFALSPDGRFLLAANQRSGNICVFRIDKDTGMLHFTGNEVDVPAPVCLEFL